MEKDEKGNTWWVHLPYKFCLRELHVVSYTDDETQGQDSREWASSILPVAVHYALEGLPLNQIVHSGINNISPEYRYGPRCGSREPCARLEMMGG